MKYSMSQIYLLGAAVLFLAGAIFMLVNTFADESWAFWTGLAFAIVAAAIWGMHFYEARKDITKKLADSSYSDTGDNKMEHGKKTKTTKTETSEN